MMDMLGIKELRPPASHDPKSPNAVNYDEAKANRYPKTLPDPLKLKNGKRVTSAKSGGQSGGRRLWRISIAMCWDACRRTCPKVTWEVMNTSR